MKLSVVTMPDAKLGYKSREQLKAVAEGKVAMANTFGGAIGDEHPIFGLSSLPFVAGDIAQARRLYDSARPAYEAALKSSGLAHEMHTYPGTQHGFHNNSTPRYYEASAKLAWERTIAFFKKQLV